MTKKGYCVKCGKTFSRKYFQKHQRICKGTNLKSEESSTKKVSGEEAIQLFDDKLKELNALADFDKRWGHGTKCPNCGHTEISQETDRYEEQRAKETYTCINCNHSETIDFGLMQLIQSHFRDKIHLEDRVNKYFDEQ